MVAARTDRVGSLSELRDVSRAPTERVDDREPGEPPTAGEPGPLAHRRVVRVLVSGGRVAAHEDQVGLARRARAPGPGKEPAVTAASREHGTADHGCFSLAVSTAASNSAAVQSLPRRASVIFSMNTSSSSANANRSAWYLSASLFSAS